VNFRNIYDGRTLTVLDTTSSQPPSDLESDRCILGDCSRDLHGTLDLFGLRHHLRNEAILYPRGGNSSHKNRWYCVTPAGRVRNRSASPKNERRQCRAWSLWQHLPSRQAITIIARQHLSCQLYRRCPRHGGTDPAFATPISERETSIVPSPQVPILGFWPRQLRLSRPSGYVAPQRNDTNPIWVSACTKILSRSVEGPIGGDLRQSCAWACWLKGSS